MPPRLLQSLKTGPVSIGVFRVSFPAGKSSRSMEASKLSDAQKAFIVKQGDDGVPVAGSCRKAGISQATYFNWRKKYAGLLPDEMGRLKALEDENSRLKKIVPDLILDREMLRGKSSAEGSEACQEAQACRRDAGGLGHIDPTGPQDPEVRHDDLPLQVPAHRAGPSRKTDQGDLRDTRSA